MQPFLSCGNPHGLPSHGGDRAVSQTRLTITSQYPLPPYMPAA